MYFILSFFVLLCSFSTRVDGMHFNCSFPLPQVFPLPSFPLCINLREPTTSALRGATLGARIKKYRPLVMSLVHGRKKSTLARSLVLSVKLDARYGRRRCGSDSVFEITHSVNKYALIKFSFSRLRAQHALTKQALARNCGLSLTRLILRVKRACAVEAQ